MPSPKGPSPAQRKVFTAERSQPLPTERDRREEARELAGEFGFRVRRFLAEQLEEFRASDKYFKTKAAIVAAWLVVSGVSMGIAGSGGEANPADNDLEARVKLQPTALGWGLLVVNESDDAWSRVVLTMNGRYSYEREHVGPGDRLVGLGPHNFTADGGAMPATEKPTSLEIKARGRTVVVPLSP